MINIIYPVYNLTDATKNTHLNIWKNYSLDTKRKIHFYIIDDCSKNPLDLILDFRINLTHLRINTNIKWNQDGANNLAFKLAKGWCFKTDIDHIFSQEDDVEQLIKIEKKRNTIYHVNRLLNKNRIKPHINSFLIHSDDFWKIGGYDEDFCGAYGYGDLFFLNKADKLGFKRKRIGINTTVFLEFAADLDRSLNNKSKYKQKKKALNDGTYISGLPLRFCWEIKKQYKIDL